MYSFSGKRPDEGDHVIPVNGSGAVQGSFNLPESQRDEMVKRCIRYLLARKETKKPVRRGELSKHMFQNLANIGKKHRIFDGALEQAQETLRNTLGMDIVVITSHSRSRPTKAYILVSTLPQHARPENTDSLALTGFMMAVASMILLQPGCRINEQELCSALRRIGVHVREREGHEELNRVNVKELLEKVLVEQWYFEREKEDNITYYTIGPRLRAELGDDDFIEFVKAVFRLGIGSESQSRLDENAHNELKMRLKVVGST